MTQEKGWLPGSPGSHPAVISILALGLLHLSHPTLALRVRAHEQTSDSRLDGLISACATSGEYASFRSRNEVGSPAPAGRDLLMRKRREFIAGLGAAAAIWPLAAHAQQPAMPVIGVMSPLTAATAARNLAALRQGLRDLGYSEGRNIKIDYRFADGAPERYPALIAELIALKPAVIVVGFTPAAVAASKVTRTTPLVWVGVADNPVALGLVESFARPGGNVTGF